MEFIIFLIIALAFPVPAFIIGFIYFCWLFKVKKPTTLLIAVIACFVGLTILVNTSKVISSPYVTELFIQYRLSDVN